SPKFVTSLMWAVAARTLFTALIPIFIWAILRWHGTRNTRWLAVVGFVFILMMSAHRLTVLMGAILVAFILTLMLVVIARILRIRYASRILSPTFRRASNVVFFAPF